MPRPERRSHGCHSGCAERRLKAGSRPRRERDSVRLEPVIDVADPSAITSTLDLQDSRSPEEETEYACTMGPAARLIEEKKPDEAMRATIRREMIGAFAVYAQANGTLLPTTVFVVSAHRTR